MNLSYKIDNVKQKNLLNVAFDVSKAELNMYTELGEANIQCINDCFPNQVDIITTKLAELQKLAFQHGFSNINVICEPTGGYEKKLLTLARQVGCYTAYVSGESVCKSKVIENNESSKNDVKDPRVILLVARYGKLIKHRILPDEYDLLRNYNRMHDQENEQKTYYKNLLADEVRNLFCDFSFTNAYLFGTGGRVVMNYYHANPYRIVKRGYAHFSRVMSTRAKGIRKNTIDRLWADALRSVNLILPTALITLLDQRIKHLWQTYLGHEQCLIQIKEQMARIYQGLGEAGEALPPIIKGFVSQVNLARIIGETGPLTDFNHQRQIKRFGGLNIRERKSGKYRGKNKMSKKGRSRLRLILNQSIFHLIKKDRIFGEYYHSKKAKGMVGTKAMAVVSKKLVDILFALSKPGAIFDIERLFVCESKYKNVA